MAKEARRREVSRAVREYVLASEARRREEHGAGPPLEELTKKKKVSYLQHSSLVLTCRLVSTETGWLSFLPPWKRGVSSLQT